MLGYDTKGRIHRPGVLLGCIDDRPPGLLALEPFLAVLGGIDILSVDEGWVRALGVLGVGLAIEHRQRRGTTSHPCFCHESRKRSAKIWEKTVPDERVRSSLK